MIDITAVGKTIAALRQKTGMSQQALANLCSVTHQAVSKWENGLALPDIQTLLLISRHFGVSMEDILTGTLPDDNKEPAQEAPPTPDKPDVPSDAADPGTDWDQVICMLPFASRETTETLILSALDENENKPPMSAVIAMLPFASMETAEKLATAAWDGCQPELLVAVAPFVSTRFLGDLVRHSDDLMQGNRLDAIQPLLPFLPGDIADELILKGAARPQSIRRIGKKGSLEYNMDLDFGRVGRSIGSMGRKIGKTFSNLFSSNTSDTPPSPSDLPQESPFLRIARKAVESANITWLRDHFCDLSARDANEILQLMAQEKRFKLAEEMADSIDWEEYPAGTAALLDSALTEEAYPFISRMLEEGVLGEDAVLFLCARAVAKWDRELIRTLIDRIDDERPLKILLDAAMEKNDWELITLITEQL